MQNDNAAPARVLSARRVLAVSSGGGHWVELVRLLPAFDGCNVAFATVDEASRVDVGLARFYTFSDFTRWSKFRWALSIAKLAWIVFSEKPDIVISTGAAPGYVALRLGKLFGAKTIWLDSIANVDSLSLSGQMAGKHADLWLTQWPHLEKVGGPIFRGTVL